MNIYRNAPLVALAACVSLLAAAMPGITATPPDDLVLVSSADETTPSAWSGDSVDDAGIWVNAASPAQSLVVANNKKGALEVYDLQGERVQSITSPTGFWGNVDVRGDYVVVAKSGMLVFRVVPESSSPLQPALESSGNAETGGEGLCLYDPGAPGVADGLYGVNIQRSTDRIRMHPLTDDDGDGQLVVMKHTKQFYLSSEGEGCVVDDATGYLYLSEEDVGIWRFDLTATGTGAPPQVKVADVGPDLAPDVEGLTLAGRFLIASAQNVDNPHASWFGVYDKSTFEHLRNFRVIDGAGSGDCDQTDGITASTAELGAEYPSGLFVCQDGFDASPGSAGFQNFKFVPLQNVLP